MPDKYIDVETETRRLSLCLFDCIGITVPNRCSNCPGAARAPIHHRRCPREHLQPNIFRPEDADSKIITALKSLASSSKQHESRHHEAYTVLPSFARLSLVDCAGTAKSFGQSDSDPDFPGVRAELSATPSIHHGGKRKAELEDPEEASSLAKSMFIKNEFDHLSVPECLKPLKPLRDLGPGNLVVPGCIHISSDEMTALRNSSAATPMDTEEDRPLGDTSSSLPFVPGFCVNTVLEGCVLVACNDGIASLDEMEP